MQDVKVTILEETMLDLDIVGGEPVLNERDSFTEGQRASIAAYIARGSIPGMEDFGITWDSFFSMDNTSYVDVNNQCLQNIQEYVPNSEKQYMPVLVADEDGRVRIQVVIP